jgi:hypothetical protein
MAGWGSSFFDAEFRLREIDTIGDPLQKLDAVIDWEVFRPTLTNAFAKDTLPKGPGGRPPFDYVLRFKVLILQALYNLSDDAMEYKLNDRRTFQRFIGLDDMDMEGDAGATEETQQAIQEVPGFPRQIEHNGQFREHHWCVIRGQAKAAEHPRRE